jgi:DNA-binding CsgD family transcriptional regulator
MKTPITPAEEKVGLMLSSGLTKKEAANKLGNSEKTICRHADSLYKKTGSKNLADITRFFFCRYTGALEDKLIKAMHDSLVIAVILFSVWVVNTPEVHEIMKAALSEISTSITHLVKW